MLGTYGQKIISTPNIDRIAKEGMRFTNAHGCTYCAPARASLLTGLHDAHKEAWKISKGKKTVNYDRGKISEEAWKASQAEPVDADLKEVFLGQIAQKAGYVTAQFGKLDWGFQTSHNRLTRHGWDHYVGYYDHVRAHGFYPKYLWKNGDKLPLEGNTDDNAGKGANHRKPKKDCVTYSQNVLVKELLEFMQKNKDRPFFIYHSTQLPHGPISIPDVHPSVANDDRLTDNEKDYASMVLMLDEHVGLILKELKTLGLDNDTIVFFTSDNGHEVYYMDMKSAHVKALANDYRGEGDVFDGTSKQSGLKWSIFQGGISVPLMARWPGKIKPGGTSNRLTANYDFLPTLADLTGVETPPGKDGLSLLPELLGKESPEHDYIIVNNDGLSGDTTIITKDHWKLVDQKAGIKLLFPKGVKKVEKKKYLLFNLKEDPSESNDLSDSLPEKVNELQSLMAREVGSNRRDLKQD